VSRLTIVKIGGNIIDDAARLEQFLRGFAAVSGYKILVHGGGKLATRLAEKLDIPQQLVDGRRITDAATLEIVTMVYAGQVNKTIVAKLQSEACNAFGIIGADGDSIRAHRRTGKMDFGFVGDIDSINGDFFRMLLEAGLTPVCAPLTHDGKGQLLNTNADTIAQELASALGAFYEVSLVYSFEKAGVLRDANDEKSVITEINAALFSSLKTEGIVSGGMLPKLQNAFAAIDAGVKEVVIGKAEDLSKLLSGETGTRITHG
jgi:acetylglutamate kinase